MLYRQQVLTNQGNSITLEKLITSVNCVTDSSVIVTISKLLMEIIMDLNNSKDIYCSEY